MEKGTMVEIYEDPETCEYYEGKARLVKQIIPGNFPGAKEYWSVRFIGDHKIYDRWIKPGNGVAN